MAGMQVIGRQTSVAMAIAYAIDQPEDINIGEITLRSAAQP
jgi:NADP-dependent 3-hydroxy acid dehydrogenase YdfG